VTEELSLACQWGRCQDCPDRDDYVREDACMCHCHVDVDDDDSDDWAFQ